MSNENNFKPTLEGYKPLRPFNLFMKNNFPFIENTFEALDTYGLLCEIVKYLNVAIENVNTTEDNIELLSNAFNELNDYVSNYFDNLDVQEEINNKLDEMAENGSLKLVIRSYIDPLFNAYASELNQSVENTLNTQNNRIASVESQVSGAVEGTPLVASSTSGMTNTSRIYVNTSDGKWYYHNGSSWVAGGTYQSTGVGTGSVSTINLDNNLRNQIHSYYPYFTVTEGYYINYNGVVATSSAFLYTSPIELKKNQKIIATVQGYSTTVALLAQVTSEGNFVKTLIRSTDATTTTIEYTATEDIYVAISSHKNYFNMIGINEKLFSINDKIGLNNLDEIVEEQIYLRPVTYSLTLNNYINLHGSIQSSNGFCYTSPIELKRGEIIHAKIEGYSTYVALVSTCDYDGDNIVPEIVSTDNTLLTIDYEAKADTYVILSGKTSTLEIYNINKKLLTNEDLPIITENIKGIYSNAVFIGDSLTVGQTYISDNAPRFYQNYYNYPYYVQKLMDIDTIERYAFGGATATSWWTRNQDYITSENSVYFVWLGTNSTFTDTVATDCQGTDYTQYANNETGNMGRILGKISSLTGNKIVLLNCYAGGTAENLANTNKVLHDFAEKFNCIEVNLKDSDITNRLYHVSYNNYYNGAHLNNCGYNRVATIVNNELIKVYYDNAQQFEHFKSYE